ncbi:MAG: GlcNAc-PI de-N-acetylase [Euryarchaeota archaeon]|nr:GlcNAc-PI de-N-acetylase [Euryarchaeota archaeon]
MRTVLVVAPHPDDETLGCGGTLLRHCQEGDAVHWMIVSEMTSDGGYSLDQIQRRNKEISSVAEAYKFEGVHRLGFPSSQLDTYSIKSIVDAMAVIFRSISPNILYLPFPADAHTDHQISFKAASACTKAFRFNSVRKVMCMEIPSETNFSITPIDREFRPNCYVDINPFLNQKVSIMELYDGEISDFPFPRSDRAIKSLAYLRGAEAGRFACESFMLLREIY